ANVRLECSGSGAYGRAMLACFRYMLLRRSLPPRGAAISAIGDLGRDLLAILFADVCVVLCCRLDSGPGAIDRAANRTWPAFFFHCDLDQPQRLALIARAGTSLLSCASVCRRCHTICCLVACMPCRAASGAQPAATPVIYTTGVRAVQLAMTA
ncbi:hypothetical protein, partial [Xanthomonas fragariae]|uniref:hypothetical protein n=1 Tax=Xanthomonas fragariae TaxID=48664 RepID=UPI001F307FA9